MHLSLSLSAAGARGVFQGLSMKFGRYTAHRRIQHASGARHQDPSPICLTLSFGASSFGSGRARGTLQLGVGLPRRSRGSPGDLGTVEWGNAVHVHEPSGISVRNLGEGSVGAHDRTAREGHTKRPCGRFHVSRASRTWETESQHATIIVRLMWRDDTGLDRARRL